MGLEWLTSQKQRESKKERKDIKAKHKGKRTNVLTPPEKDEIMLAMAESLGFYDPTP